MVDASNFAWGTTEDLWLPCVKVRIEVDHGDGAVCAVDGTQEWQGDGVVASKCDDSRKCLSVLCWTLLLGIRCRGAGQD
jgi:hypothetical protein